MLLELRVRNLALIEKADVEFHSGLNVLTGETGAGKSILIDSINMALGAKASKDRIRYGADYGYGLRDGPRWAIDYHKKNLSSKKCDSHQ